MDAVVVNTVDGFQGGEKDVIIFLAVRANDSGIIGFVKDPRRLNVAITRGRYCVWIVGHARTLGMKNELWKALINDAKARGCFWRSTDDTKTRKLNSRATHVDSQEREIDRFSRHELATHVDSQEREIDRFSRHDSVLFQNLIWQVYFSEEFKNTITRMKSAQNRQRVISSVVQLANGQRPPYTADCPSVTKKKYNQVIYQASIGESILVWTIDVQRTDPVKQFIKVWDVVALESFVGLIRRLEAAFSTYSEAYLERCAAKKLHAKERNVFVPKAWKMDPSFPWFKILPEPAASTILRESQESEKSRDNLDNATLEKSLLQTKLYSFTKRSAFQLINAVDDSRFKSVESKLPSSRIST